MATMNDTMIQLKGISKSYGDVPVLDRVDLEVKRGEFLVLLGASGCGKSTLLNLMAGFITPNTGTVTINGRAVTDVTAACGMVFQQYALFPWRTVQENVEFGLKMRGMSKQERAPIARKYIEMVGLKAAADKYPHALSGGMKQRVSIARVLANDPDVMLFDEPFAALDAITRGELQDDLLRMCRLRRTTVLFVTHDITEAVYLGDHIVVMQRGRLLDTLRITLDAPRSQAMRHGAEFNRYCARVRTALDGDTA